MSPSPSPLEWILDPDKPRTLLNRILAHIVLAEAKETNPHYRDDYHIAWITCKWAFDGVRQPHVAATYRVLGVHPNLVWNHILADRQAKLASEFSLWYDAAGNLRPDLPKKSSQSSLGEVSTERGTCQTGCNSSVDASPERRPASGRVNPEINSTVAGGGSLASCAESGTSPNLNHKKRSSPTPKSEKEKLA